MAVLAILWLLKWQKCERLEGLSWLGSSLFGLAILVLYVFPRIIYASQAKFILDEGGNPIQFGFFGETILSLLDYCSYGQWAAETLVVAGWFIAWMIVLLGIHAWQYDKVEMKILSAVMVTVFIISELAAMFGGVQLLRERTALFFLPMFILLIAFAAQEYHSKALWAFLALALLVGMKPYSLHYTYIWRSGSDVSSMMQRVESFHKKTGKNVVLGISNGIKWNVWYYAQKQLHLPDNAGNKHAIHDRQFDWLTVKELHHGSGPPVVGNTNLLFLDPTDTADIGLRGTYFPSSGWTLSW